MLTHCHLPTHAYRKLTEIWCELCGSPELLIAAVPQHQLLTGMYFAAVSVILKIKLYNCFLDFPYKAKKKQKKNNKHLEGQQKQRIYNIHLLHK